MRPLNLLRITFARDRSFGGQVPGVCPPIIGKEARDAKGLQQGFELQEHLVSATTKAVRQDLSGPVINGGPEPARLLLLPDKAPHCVDFSGLPPLNAPFSIIWP